MNSTPTPPIPSEPADDDQRTPPPLGTGTSVGMNPQRDDSFGAIARRLGPASVLAAAWMLLPAVLGFALLANMQAVADWMAPMAHWQQVVLYSVVFMLSAGFGLLPTYAQAAFGGYLFRSMLIGVPAALAGFGGAAVIGYVIARSLGREKVQAELDRHPKARAVQEALIGRGFWPTLGIVTLVRVPPNSPFALTNLVLATAGVSKRVYLIATLVGMAPRTAVVVWLGTQIQDWSQQEKPMWYFIAGIATTIVALVVISHIANKALERVTRQPGAQPPAADTRAS